MTRKNRRQLLENLAAHIDPVDHRTHLEEQLRGVKQQASRIMIQVQQVEDDPHAGEADKLQLDRGYEQLESLLWRVEDLESRLAELDDAHVSSITGTNRAQRRAAEKQKRRRSENKPPDQLNSEPEQADD